VGPLGQAKQSQVEKRPMTWPNEAKWQRLTESPNNEARRKRDALELAERSQRREKTVPAILQNEAKRE